MVSTAFVSLGKAQSAALGCPDLPLAIIPHPFGSRTRDEVRDLAQACVADIVRVMAQGRGSGAAAGKPAPAASGRARTIETPEDQDEFDQFCRQRGWSDGLPLVRPTAARVDRLLAGTRRKRHELVAELAPSYGAATVEAIAINAAMAGCGPAHMPVLIAAIEALADPRFNLQGIQATTNPATPFVIVSGPLAATLGFNAGVNCLGQGSWMNATLGRAVRLCLQNIGGARPGEMDRATHGHPGKYTFCCAENHAESPWAPLHVDRGFAAGDSCVTVMGGSGTLNMNTHAKDAADLLRVFADTLMHPTSNDYWFGGEPWIVLSPEHAAVAHAAGLTKSAFRKQLWEDSRMKAARFSRKDFERSRHTRRGELGETTPESLFPIAPDPEHIGIVVAGGPGTHSVYVPGFGNTRSVTRRIDD